MDIGKRGNPSKYTPPQGFLEKKIKTEEGYISNNNFKN
jgi:hypothetical protein